MKLLLIAPSWKNIKHRRIENFLKLNLHPKYNILLLGNYAERLGWEVTIVDETYETIPWDSQFDLVGVTAVTSKVKRAYQIADHFQLRNIPVILGGIHATACPDEATQHVKILALGEADLIWPTILKDAELRKLKSVYHGDSSFDLSNLPIINYNLLSDPYSYRHPTVLEATRGCPYHCTFCSTSFFGRKYRKRPIKDIIENLQNIPEHYVVFMDDNLTGDPNYAIELFEAMASIGGIPWTGHVTIDVALNDRLLKAIAKSGCRNVVPGFDTLELANLYQAKKEVNQKINYDLALQKIHDVGVDIMASFIFGFDCDTEKSFESVFNFVSKHKIFLPNYWILTPYPGTKIYQQFLKEKRITNFNWNFYDSRHLVFEPKKMTQSKFMDCFKWLERHSFGIHDILKRAYKPKDRFWNISRKLKFNAALRITRELGVVHYGE